MLGRDLRNFEILLHCVAIAKDRLRKGHCFGPVRPTSVYILYHHLIPCENFYDLVAISVGIAAHFWPPRFPHLATISAPR